MHRLFPPSWVLVVLWALPWAGFGQASDSEPWTLQQCLEHAQTNNLDLKQAELGLARGEAGLLAAQGAFLPNLNAQSSYGVNIGQRIDPLTNTFASDPVQSGNLGLSSSITLFNGMQNQINLKRAKLGMDLAATNAEVVQNNLALRVASSYLSVLFQREFLTIAQTNADATNRQVDRVQKLVDAGAAAESDLLDVMAQRASDVSAVVSAENAVQLALLSLGQLLQLTEEAQATFDVAAPEKEMLMLTELPASSRAAVDYALSNFPDMRAADMQITDAYLGLDLAKANRLPSVRGSYSLGSGYSENRKEYIGEPTVSNYLFESVSGDLVPYQDVNFDNVSEQTMSVQDQFSNNLNQSVFFSLSIPVFNNFGIKAGIERAEVDVLSAKLAKEQTAQGLRQAVESAFFDARAAKRTFEANDQALDAARLAMSNAEARFEAGAISALEYADARTRLDNASLNALRTQYDFVFKTRILDFYMGRPLSL